MEPNLLSFPEYYPWSNRLYHYRALHHPKSGCFKAGDWLRFIHRDDLVALLRDMVNFNQASPETHQDLILLTALMFMWETQRGEFPESRRWLVTLIQQLCRMVHLELLRRDGLVFLEQRLSSCPGFSPEILPTRHGHDYLQQHGEWPSARQYSLL